MPDTNTDTVILDKKPDTEKQPESDKTTDFPRPSMTADIILWRERDGNREVLLIERGNEPFKGAWAIPGGFLEPAETIEACAERELREETNLRGVDLRLVGVFSEPGRDPRGWVVSVAFMGHLTSPTEYAGVRAGDDAKTATWFPVSDLPALAFDHTEILAAAMRLQHKLDAIRGAAEMVQRVANQID